MAGRILVIRGGAIGDFVLTLPALRLLREGFPEAEIELLAYTHIAALAQGRYYVRRVRSIEYGPMAGFFARRGTRDPELSAYFASFDQVVSYLYDPDGIFEANLREVGVRNFLGAYAKPVVRHAAREWAAPLERLALFLEDPAARIFLSEADVECGRERLGREERRRLAVHPGSGSGRKNWGVEQWAELGERFWGREPEGEVVLVGGEADGRELAYLREAWVGRRVVEAVGLPLLELAAVLACCGSFAGHDSGVSHVAAAVGARGVVLFGPTDPEVWAPQNAGVRVVRAPGGEWGRLEVGEVWGAVEGAVEGCLG